MQAVDSEDCERNRQETVSIIIWELIITLKKLSGGAAGMMMASGAKDEEELAAERERIKEECEERVNKNKEWRERRERERLGVPEVFTKKVDKKLRNEKVREELVCRNCR